MSGSKLVFATLSSLKLKVMKKVPLVITLASLYVFIFHASPVLGLPVEVIVAMFVLSPFVVIFMAYIILKFGKPSGYTFDEKFYDDTDYRRNGKE
jgi:hypothetical protein